MSKKPTINSRLSRYLKKLLFDKDINVAQLSKEIDIPQPTLNRIILGKTKNPQPKSLEKMADYLGVPVNEITKFTEEESKLIENEIIKIPLFTIPEIKSRNFVQELPALNQINIDAPLGENCFAVTLNNSSMEPMFLEGTTLIFNPDKEPKDKSFVLVFLQDKLSSIFRELLIDADFQYLKTTNPSLSTSPLTVLESKDKILGTLVEARRSYNIS